MIIGILVFLVLAVIIGVCGCFIYDQMDEAEMKKGLVAVAGAALALAIIAVPVVPFSFHTVQTGQVAVVKQFGEIVDVKEAGLYFDIWFLKSYKKYDTKVRNVEILTAAYSSDAQTMEIQMNLQYKIKADKAKEIATQYGTLAALQSRIEAVTVEKTKEAMSGYTAMDIIGNRAQMSQAVDDAVRKVIGEEYFVDVVAVILTNIDFSDAFETAVEEKMIAEQNQLKAEYENEAKVKAAEAEAQAKIIAAEGEAKANELLRKSLTEEVLLDKYLEKWNGELPKVSGEAGIMLPSDILE